MNKFLEEASDHYQIAEHLFETTLPLAKDPKLLLCIVKSIGNCLEKVIDSILTQEGIISKEGPIHKINLLRPLAAKHNFPTKYLTFMLRIQELLHFQKNSPLEFTRSNSRVICDDKYSLEVLSPMEIKEYLLQTKKILKTLK